MIAIRMKTVMDDMHKIAMPKGFLLQAFCFDSL